MSNIERLQSLYQSFGSGDIPAILEAMSEDVAWEHWDDNTAQRAGVPWYEARNGREGVAKFFDSLGGMEIHDFQVLNLMEGGNQVAVTVKQDFTVKATGERVRDEEIHLWTFDDAGKISGMRHYTDTASTSGPPRARPPRSRSARVTARTGATSRTL
jgi:ketosteroid isomerase-like protein